MLFVNTVDTKILVFVALTQHCIQNNEVWKLLYFIKWSLAPPGGEYEVFELHENFIKCLDLLWIITNFKLKSLRIKATLN